MPDASRGPLAGRVALVTGASRKAGIGFAVARRLASLGADLLVHTFSGYDEGQRWYEPADMAACLEELRGLGRVEHLDADLGDAAVPARLVERAHAAFGRLDVVIANHTHWAAGGVDEIDAESLDRHYAVCVRASVLLAAEMARRREPGPGGRVIFFTSGQHLGPMPGELGYVAAKGALHQLTATLADELAERGITVNTINPGPVDTGWVSEELRPELLAKSPFGRLGQPEDVANLVAWLVSEEGAWLTGQVLSSEGGFRRR
jgi:3-oxoacyl-[acyl-carrier protein] reductase